MPSPPYAEKIAHSNQLHGIIWSDDYAWLRDDNWQQVIKDPSLLNPKIRRYLEAENAYSEIALSSSQHLQNDLFAELKGRIAGNDQSVPKTDGEYAYYTRYLSDQEHPVFCRHHIKSAAAEEILLDANAAARGFEYFNLSGCQHSPDHRYLAYCLDTCGGENFSLYIRDLTNKTDLPYCIDNVQVGSIAWSNDSQHLAYIKLNTDYRPELVYLHTLQTKPDNDKLLYQEKDPGFFLNLYTTRSQRFIVIQAHAHNTSELHLLNRNDLAKPATLIQKREPDLEYFLEERNNELWILTNADGNEDYKLCKTDLNHPQRQHWQDVVIPAAGVLLKDFWISKEFMVRLEIEKALPRLVIMPINGEEHSICFDESAYELAIISTYEYDNPLLRFTYTSMTTPKCTYDYHCQQRTRKLLKQDEIPSGHKTKDYITERLYAPADDGQNIPMTLLYKKADLDKFPLPLLLYGYGSYGHSLPAGFSPNRLSLVDRGFIYAIAHVRGGMENGYAWYKNGKAAHKKNTFKDFIRVAEHLIQKKYTQQGKIAIHGGSAGGMLIGAVLNQAPDLFKVAVANVPFVDVLNTMCDAGLPLTPPEWNEWGNPIQSKTSFDYIHAYSPYDNVTAQQYPHLLVTAGISDPRVTYWEPAKWVAKLRATKMDDNLLLLKTNMSAGHSGAAGRFSYLHEIAMMYAFILKSFAIK